MNKIYVEKLLKDFPTLYRQYYLSPQETCMCWGFDVNDGWYNLIYKLSLDLMAVNPECEATQVKEKFGGLRFYIENGNEEAYKLIQWAENMSYSICEECGKPGKPNDDGWIKTLCKDCRNKDDEARTIKFKKYKNGKLTKHGK